MCIFLCFVFCLTSVEIGSAVTTVQSDCVQLTCKRHDTHNIYYGGMLIYHIAVESQLLSGTKMLMFKSSNSSFDSISGCKADINALILTEQLLGHMFYI